MPSLKTLRGDPSPRSGDRLTRKGRRLERGPQPAEGESSRRLDTVCAVAKVYNQKSMRKLLEDDGWKATLGGKHNVKMVKPGEPRPITLPAHKRRDYGPGLAASILRQAGLS